MSNIRAFCMPKWGIEMTEGTLAEWMVKEGDTFKRGQVLCLIETAMAALVPEKAFAGRKAPPVLVTPPHTPIPFARELESAYLPSVDQIEAAVRKVLSWR